MLCRVKKKRKTLQKVAATFPYNRIVCELLSCIFSAAAICFLVFLRSLQVITVMMRIIAVMMMILIFLVCDEVAI